MRSCEERLVRKPLEQAEYRETMARNTKIRRLQRVMRNRAKLSGTPERPRLAVFRSNKNMSLQLIDDKGGNTLAAASTKELKSRKKTKTEEAFEVGELLAERAKKANISVAILDRRFYKYHGRVQAATDGARKGGLTI